MEIFNVSSGFTELELGLQVGGRLVITATTHLDQSNHLPNQKQGAIDKYDLTRFI
jgi:hypothetical protein